MYPDEILELEDLGTRIIVDNGERQLRLSISEFRGGLYISLRWWLLGFHEDEFFPSKEGVTIPYTIANTGNLFNSLVSLLSESEVLNQITKYDITPDKEDINEKQD